MRLGEWLKMLGTEKGSFAETFFAKMGYTAVSTGEPGRKAALGNRIC